MADDLAKFKGRIELSKLTKRPPTVVEKGSVTKILKQERGSRLYPQIISGACDWRPPRRATGSHREGYRFRQLERTKAGLRIKSTKSEKPRRFAVTAAALDALCEHGLEQDRDRALFGPDYRDKDLVFCRPEGDYYSPDRAAQEWPKQ